ncbi:unnamed protein product [Discosporangium mesarthrocarpum]
MEYTPLVKHRGDVSPQNTAEETGLLGSILPAHRQDLQLSMEDVDADVVDRVDGSRRNEGRSRGQSPHMSPISFQALVRGSTGAVLRHRGNEQSVLDFDTSHVDDRPYGTFAGGATTNQADHVNRQLSGTAKSLFDLVEEGEPVRETSRIASTTTMKQKSFSDTRVKVGC